MIHKYFDHLFDQRPIRTMNVDDGRYYELYTAGKMQDRFKPRYDLSLHLTVF